jgi:hypothetical protein
MRFWPRSIRWQMLARMVHVRSRAAQPGKASGTVFELFIPEIPLSPQRRERQKPQRRERGAESLIER